mgnify:CR=1 FL=1
MATIRKRNNKYQAQVRTKGFKPVTKTFNLRGDALKWATLIEADQSRGVFSDDSEASNTKFLDCLDRYEQEQEDQGRRSIVKLRSQLNLIRKSDLAHLTLANVTPKEITKYKLRRLETVKASTCIKDLTMLHAMFDCIQKEWHIVLPKGNPLDLVSHPKHSDPTSRDRRLEDDEEDRILKDLNIHSYQTALIVRFALETGMRRGEILNLEFGHMSRGKNKEKVELTLFIPVTKTDNPRTIPLSKKADSIVLERVQMIMEEGDMDISDQDLMTFKLFDMHPDSVTSAFSRACKRLDKFLCEVKQKKPHYHARPVAPFGDKKAQLLIVGLAPGMHGANATGRPFIGDASGVLLYENLFNFGFSNRQNSISFDDSLRLKNCRITNAVKCLPPQNKPTAVEINQCNHFLAEEISSLPEQAVIMALGSIAHQAVLKAYGLKLSSAQFGHNKQYPLPDGKKLVSSYHCSRYNLQTKRLTPEMFADVFETICQLIK